MEIMQAVGIVIGALLILAGAVNTVGSAWEKVASVRKAAKAPNDEQNRRLVVLENDVKEIRGFLASLRVLLPIIKYCSLLLPVWAANGRR